MFSIAGIGICGDRCAEAGSAERFVRSERAPVLHEDGRVDAWKENAPGHYGAIGIPPAASQRQIEVAFRGWTDRHRSGAISGDAFRRAESAYHVLSVPETRARHDRQLGLVPHPAWTAGREVAARACVRRALGELGHGRAGRARRLLCRAVWLAPENPQARSYLALALARTGGCLHDADRHGRYAIERRPREAAFFFNLAEVYAAAGLRARAWAFRVRGWHALAVALMKNSPHA